MLGQCLSAPASGSKPPQLLRPATEPKLPTNHDLGRLHIQAPGCFRKQSVLLQSRKWTSSFSWPLKKPGSSTFLEKLPREIRTMIYNYFLMPRWAFDIPKSRRRTIGYAPQELIDNSLEPCLSSVLLNICTQIRREYTKKTYSESDQRKSTTLVSTSIGVYLSPSHNSGLWCLYSTTWFSI